MPGLVAAFRSLVARTRAVPSSGGSQRLGWFAHEPRTGAWQRNLSCATEDVTAFSAVFACISIISGDIAKLGLQLWRTMPHGGRELATTHPYFRLLQRPNQHQTIVEFMTSWMSSLLLTGNAYILMQRDGREVVSSLHVLDPRRVRVFLSDQGEPFYRVGDDLFSEVVLDQVVPARDMIHDRMTTLHHPLVGVSPLISATASAQAGNHILAQAQEFFEQMSRPSGLLVPQIPGVLPETTVKLLRDMWQANYGGPSNAGRTAVLPANMEWKPLTMTAVDSQLIEQLKFSVEDVARCFRVPGFMLGDLTKVSYRNAEQLSRIYYQGCLQYHLERIEWRLDASLDLATDVSAEFNLDALFRMESDVRFQSYRDALQAGWLSINEVRNKEGLAPVKGGEQPRIQVQYQPLDAPPPAAPPEPLLLEDETPEDAPPPEDDDDDDDEDFDNDSIARMAVILRGKVVSYAEAA